MLDRVTLTAIAARVRLPGGEGVSERTLRRRYGGTARLLFGTPWWMPEPVDAVRAVLAPRVDPSRGSVWPRGREAQEAAAVVDDCFCPDGRPERDGRNRILHASCCKGERADDVWPPAEFFTGAGVEDPLGDPVRTSPEPIPLRDMLCDLHVVITGHLVATGWASRLLQIAALRRERPEVAAWVTLSEQTWAERLAPQMAVVFGLERTAGAVAAQAFIAVLRELEPRVGDLGDAVNRVARGAGRTDAIARAETELHAARATAFDLLSVALSEPDTIRERSGRGTVELGGRHGLLPYRRPAAAAGTDRPTG